VVVVVCVVVDDVVTVQQSLHRQLDISKGFLELQNVHPFLFHRMHRTAVEAENHTSTETQKVNVLPYKFDFITARIHSVCTFYVDGTL